MMADRKRSGVWLHFTKQDADNAICNICKTKYKAGCGNTSNLRKHLIKHKIYLKAQECTVFGSLTSRKTEKVPPAAAASAEVESMAETLSDPSTSTTTSSGN